MKTLLLILLSACSLHAQLITKTETEKTAAQLAAESIVDAINAELTHRVQVHKVAFETLWHNPREGATPEAIIAEFGNKAALVFAFSAENLAHIERCAQLVGKTRADFLSDAECTPPRRLVIHSDGTVTLH